MSIFYENYLMEHGGAHRRVNEIIQKSDRVSDEAKEYGNTYFGTRDRKAIATNSYKNNKDNSEKMKKEGNNDFAKFADNDRKYIRNKVNEKKEAFKYAYGLSDSPEANKHRVAISRQNSLKARQAEKRKNLKEACEYILSILDED